MDALDAMIEVGQYEYLLKP